MLTTVKRSYLRTQGAKYEQPGSCQNISEWSWINQEDHKHVGSIYITKEDHNRRNIPRLQKNIATYKTYLHQYHNRINITGSRKKIVTYKTYLHQDHNRLNITGSQNNIAIDGTYLERNTITIDETNLDSDRQNVRYTSGFR